MSFESCCAPPSSRAVAVGLSGPSDSTLPSSSAPPLSRAVTLDLRQKPALLSDLSRILQIHNEHASDPAASVTGGQIFIEAASDPSASVAGDASDPAASVTGGQIFIEAASDPSASVAGEQISSSAPVAAASVAGKQIFIEAASDPAASSLNNPTDPAMRRNPLYQGTGPAMQNSLHRATGLFGSMPKLHGNLSLSIPKGGRVPVTPVIYGPREVPDDFCGFDLDDFDRVAAKIDKMYEKIYSKSKVKAGVANEYLESGYCCCLGLLDPATNIIINGSIFNYAESSVEVQGGGMAERSLDGLIAFLACLFPCLPDGEALAYLDAVDADPMAAAALVLTKRGVKSDYCSFRNAATAATTMEMALRCAAVAAKHPDPSLLVKGWKSVSHKLTEVNRCLSGRRPDYYSADFVHRILGMAFPHVEVREVWRLANVRLGHCSFGSVTELLSVRAIMKRMLLARIHGFYLKALSRLPKDELNSKYHRALVMGGYCYGPLKPVANIIANMVWYEQTFPTSIEFESAMISSRFLCRIVARSLYGLISFLCARYPLLTPDHAMQRLLVADANLQLADPNLFDTRSKQKLDWSDCPQIGSGKGNVNFQERAVRKAVVSVPEAYAAAATAAFHPNPAAQKEFLGSPESVNILGSASSVFRLYDDDCQLSKQGIHFLGMHLLSSPSSVDMSHLQQEPEPTEECSGHIRCKRKFWMLHDEIKTMVLSALEKFNRDNKSQYSLHVICGVNELVSGPKLCSLEDIKSNPRGVNPSFPCKYEHCHFNFLATCLDEELHGQPTFLYFADQPTKLFFAECSRAGDDSWCAPVDCSPNGGQTRCFYCEKQGNNIIHPAWPGFHGSDFQEAFFGSLSDLYCNDNLIGMAHSLDWVHGVEEDAIYEKNCKHRVRDNGDAGNGLKCIKLKPLDGDAGNGLKRIKLEPLMFV